jgi:hypothetical protein
VLRAKSHEQVWLRCVTCGRVRESWWFQEPNEETGRQSLGSSSVGMALLLDLKGRSARIEQGFHELKRSGVEL